ncbi:YeeE/YedE family protein [Algicella marina]|nr:YeeE/YedE family protein [Algicella marina]
MSLFWASLIGGFAGFSLYHAAFGFTAGWRRLVTEGRSFGIRAQFLLIGLTAIFSYPLIGWFGAGGFVQPVGVGMAFGAFLFGAGMQFGGGCGSGTLFVVGGGSTRMVITLSFFILGSVIGHAHVPYWNELPRIGGVSAIREFGTLPALALLLMVCGGLSWAATVYEKRRHGSLEKTRETGSLLRGPWSPWLGALALTIVGVLTILVLNRPWGITQAFVFWGGKLLYLGGLSTDHWMLERIPQSSLDRSVFAHGTSVMDFGIILGAMIAAGLAGRFAPIWKLSFKDVWTAVLGGLMMGYGARLGYGCNIGAYLGGLISGSLHGWVWAIAAFAGSSLVARARMPRPGSKLTTA